MSDEEIRTASLVYALAASPDFARDEIVFAARASGLVLSNDGGTSWRDAFASLELNAGLTATAVSLSPDFAKDQLVFVGIPGGILCSKNGGATWQTSMTTTPPAFVSALVFSPNFNKDSTLFAGTMEDGVFLSTDRGDSWNPWNFGLLDGRVLALTLSPNFAVDGTLFAGTETGVFKSVNYGRSWRETSFPSEMGPVLSLGISAHFAQDATLFVGTESAGLHKTSDGGKTWNRLGEGMIPDVVNSIVISSDDLVEPELCVQIEDRLLFSYDGGESWTDYRSKALEGIDISCFVAPQGFSASARLLVGTTEGEIILA
jgi:photosystem II stability/assembly factor-like uncharacterized protein